MMLGVNMGPGSVLHKQKQALVSKALSGFKSIVFLKLLTSLLKTVYCCTMPPNLNFIKTPKKGHL